jgi:hypothetical protein
MRMISISVKAKYFSLTGLTISENQYDRLDETVARPDVAWLLPRSKPCSAGIPEPHAIFGHDGPQFLR